MEGLDREHLEEEFVPFLKTEAKLEVKMVAMDYLLGLSADKEGKVFITSGDKFITGIVSLLKDTNRDVVIKSYETLINLSTTEPIARKIMSLCPDLSEDLLRNALDSQKTTANFDCGLLSNLTRDEKCANTVAAVTLKDSELCIENIVKALSDLKYNSHANLHFLAALLGNLTQNKAIRDKIMAEDQFILQGILPFIGFQDSRTRRHGIVTVLKNCTFDIG